MVFFLFKILSCRIYIYIHETLNTPNCHLLMLLFITSILLLISHCSSALVDNDQTNEQCQSIGQSCQQNQDCCTSLSCYSIEGIENNFLSFI